MNNRIKKVRKYFGLSQDSFAKKIGITRSSVSLLESGKNNPSEQTIKLICKEYGINEIWLRTGEGKMHSEISQEDRYSINLGKLTLEENQFVQNVINSLAESDPDELKIIERYMKKCLGISDNQNKD